MTGANTSPEVLPIAVRAFLDARPPATGSSDSPSNRRFRIPDAGPSEWTLVFDTETTTDAAQQLRFGTYEVRKHQQLKESGFFYDETLSRKDRDLLQQVASDSGLQAIPVEEFIERIFYAVGYELGATIVGFNLPFDLSRLAIHHAPARGKMMRGGFSLKLSPSPDHPPIQVKRLSRRAALIRFAAPPRQRTPRGQRKRKLWVPVRRGYFVDVKTVAAALTARTFSLGTLAEFLDLPEGKLATDEHGALLTAEYLWYAVRDTDVTWQCYQRLRERYARHCLTGTPLHRVLSEAGLGKVYLKEMGIRSWREVQPDMPPDLIGRIMSTYYGGRSEVRIRREVRQIAYCDFLSMYPTVCTLMGLWRFVIAQGMTWQDATDDARELLATVTLADLQQQEFWQRLPVLVQVLPDDDLFPVRARYGRDAHCTIGLNHLSSATPLWFTLADCITSKLLTGKAPRVVCAIRFELGPVQDDLRGVTIAGNSDYHINPTQDDFYCRLIDLRGAVKHQMAGATASNRKRLDTEQLGLKILANATSYGIFVELNSEDAPKDDAVCYGPDGECFRGCVPKIETQGRYFHPLLATLITGAARLLLAAAERLIADAGLEWVFCDTDSLAIAKPDAVDGADFRTKVEAIRAWFAPLNPYAVKGSLLKLEPANFAIDEPSRAKPLFAFAVSAKRYALFNLDAAGRPILRKASAHGLGHLLAPYRDEGVAGIPPPAVDLAELGTERWQHDFWFRVACAALNGHPEQVVTSDLPNINAPAVSRYAATTPELLRWFRVYNQRRPYRQQVRPFGFLLAFQGLGMPRDASFDAVGTVDRKRNVSAKKHRRPAHALVDAPRGVAPFDRNLQKAARHCFDRNTGKPVPATRLKSYRQTLLRYHLHPETKFRGGQYIDRGCTYRRHIMAVAVQLIGKEANRWEEQFYLGGDPEAQSEYGILPADRERMLTAIRTATQLHGTQQVAVRARISRRHLYDVLSGNKHLSDALLMKLARVARDLDTGHPAVGDVLPSVRECCKKLGIRAFARIAGISDCNLGRILAGTRRLSARTHDKIIGALLDGSAADAACPNENGH